MKNTFSQQETDAKQPRGYFLILYWLASFFQLTEEEQTAAGIYIGNRNDKDPQN